MKKEEYEGFKMTEENPLVKYWAYHNKQKKEKTNYAELIVLAVLFTIIIVALVKPI